MCQEISWVRSTKTRFVVASEQAAVMFACLFRAFRQQVITQDAFAQ